MPAGSAKRRMPHTAISDARIFPRAVTGRMSMPMVESVATAHHIVAGMLVKTAG